MGDEFIAFGKWVEERFKREGSKGELADYRRNIREKLKNRLEFVTGYWHGYKRLETRHDKRADIFSIEELDACFFEKQKAYEKKKADMKQKINELVRKIEEDEREYNEIKDGNDTMKKEKLKKRLERNKRKLDEMRKKYEKMEEEYREAPLGYSDHFEELSPAMVELFDLLLEPEIIQGKKDWEKVDINVRHRIIDLVWEIYSLPYWGISQSTWSLEKIEFDILHPYESKFIDIQQWCKEHVGEEIRDFPDDEENQAKRLKLYELKEDIIKKQEVLHQMVNELEMKITEYRKISWEIEQKNLLVEKELEEITKKEIELIIQGEI